MRKIGWFNIVGLLGAFSALCLLVCVMLFTRHMDVVAANAERSRLSTRASADISASRASIASWSRSDEAIRRLDHKRDVQWAEATFPDISSAEVWTYTFDHADALISKSSAPGRTHRARVQLDRVIPRRVAALRRALSAKRLDGPAAVDFFWADQTLYMLIVAPFTATSLSMAMTHSAPPILAAVTPYEGFVRTSMAGIGLKGLFVSPLLDTGDLIRDANGRAIGSLGFTPSHPGAELRHVLIWPALSLTIAFTALIIFAQRRAETERRKLVAAERRAQHLACHDQLTELANRRFLLTTLEREVQRASRDGLPLAVLLIDLDRFKAVNDTYGHESGDQLIKEMANRLQAECVRKNDFCARLGGDEFVILATDCPPPAAVSMAGRVLARLCLPVALSAAEIQPGASIGIACFLPGVDANGLLRAADQALYFAKEGGRNRFHLASSVSPPLNLERSLGEACGRAAAG